MKRRPVRQQTEADYPDLEAFRAGRRRAMRLLALGGASVAAGGLMGCDTVLEMVGLREDPPLPGTVAVPYDPNDDPTRLGGEPPTPDEGVLADGELPTPDGGGEVAAPQRLPGEPMPVDERMPGQAQVVPPDTGTVDTADGGGGGEAADGGTGTEGSGGGATGQGSGGDGDAPGSSGGGAASGTTPGGHGKVPNPAANGGTRPAGQTRGRIRAPSS